jgi:exodeoxyribonuclease VII large subunit
MARPVKTQWEFGELFAQAPRKPERTVFSVTELTLRIRRLLEKELGQIWVTGEITNLRAQSSGHIYFTLKDAGAQLSCVLFRGAGQVNRALLQDGRKVNLGGELTVYEPRGQYQLRVTAVEAQGVGALQAAFEQLKQKLKAEGLFETERKRPLPPFPQRIGLVTSPTGAAIRDVFHVVGRRHPALEIFLAPCRVQGDGAAEEIAAAIRLLNEYHQGLQSEQGRGEPAGPDDSDANPRNLRGLDLILVTRGGGSLEDLWAFNEEVVARAIFDSALPVVSAVGHEIDFTISDFVADVRAATPSAAAEILTEAAVSSRQFLAEVSTRIHLLARQQLEDKGEGLVQVSQRLARLHPRRRLEDWLQRLDDLQLSLGRLAQQGLRQQRLAWKNLAERLSRVRPVVKLNQRRETLLQRTQRLHELARHQLRESTNRLALLQSRLHLLGPEQVLARGYSITMDAETGAVVSDAAAARLGQKLRTRLKRGELHSRVEEGPKAGR